MHDRPVLVLDTNVVLDLLLFQDLKARPLQELLLQREATWLCNARCREEFRRVLAYPAISRFLGRHARDGLSATADALARFDDWSIYAGEPCLQRDLPVCRDAEDQFLVKLAIGNDADFLVSKDRHLLAMSARLRKAGFRTRVVSLAGLLLEIS